MEATESRLTDLKSQIEAQALLLAAQDTKIAQLNTEVSRIKDELLSLKPLDTFHPFPKLPIEIRHEIWRLAIPGPRLITLVEHEKNPYCCVWIDRGKRVKVPEKEYDERVTRYSEAADGLLIEERCSSAFTRFREESSCTSTPLLITCRESRSIALPAYAFCMSTAVHADFNVTQYVIEPDTDSGADSDSDSELDSVASDYIIPHSKLEHQGYRFQPLRDTLHLAGDLQFLAAYLENCEPTELETGNVRSLAVPLRCLSYFTVLNIFLKLEELILYDDETCDELDCDSAGCPREFIREDLSLGKKLTAASRQPQVLLMKKEELSEYILSKSRAEPVIKVAFEPITPLE